METQDQNLEALFAGFVRDIRALIKKELKLAEMEFSRNLAALKRNLLFVLMGGVVTQWGVILLLAVAVVGLDQMMPLIWALLLVGGVVVLTGGLITWAAIRNIRRQTLLPRQAIEAFKINARRTENEETQ